MGVTFSIRMKLLLHVKRLGGSWGHPLMKSIIRKHSNGSFARRLWVEAGNWDVVGQVIEEGNAGLAGFNDGVVENTDSRRAK